MGATKTALGNEKGPMCMDEKIDGKNRVRKEPGN
jgi:hypothetical protein